MTTQPTFLILLGRTLSGITCPGLALLVLCAAALYKDYRRDHVPYRSAHLAVLIPLVMPIAILLWGARFGHAPAQVGRPPAWQIVVMDVLVLLQAVYHAWMLWRFKNMRLSVAAVSLLEATLSLVALLIATMSISGT